MTPDRNDPFWPYALALALLLGSIAFLAGMAFTLVRHEGELTTSALARVHQATHSRLDGMRERTESDMISEAEALRETGDTSVHLLHRWRALLRGRIALNGIMLADEHGDRIALYRSTDTSLTFTRSLPGIGRMLRTTMRLEGDPVLTCDTVPSTDPRRESWFGRTLEDNQGAPLWHIATHADTTVLRTTALLRGGPAMPFRVLLMEVNTRRSRWLDTRTAPMGRTAVAIIDGDGATLPLPEDPRTTVNREVIRNAVAEWTAQRHRFPFPARGDGQEMMVSVAPYLLNGAVLHSVAALERGPLRGWTRRERMALMALAIVVALLTVLIGWFFIQRERGNRLLRMERHAVRATEERLAKALGERDVMGREMHHRVKNNLQLLSSLLNLQAMRLEEGPARSEFLRGKQRIDTIALVHHRLYGMPDLRAIDTRAFFTGLIEALSAMHTPGSQRVSCSVEAHLAVDQDTAVGLGIILCELVSNAYRHAFPYATGGHVEVRLTDVVQGRCRLIVKDNGSGYDGAGDAARLGLDIVEAMAEQLDGGFTVRNEGGTLCEVVFRVRQGEP